MPRGIINRILVLGLVGVSPLAAWGLHRAGEIATVSDKLSIFTTIFLGIFIEAAPFLLLGTLFSGIVEVFLDQENVRRLAPRNPFLGALVGGMLGFFFPVCECGVVPFTRRLMKKGLPASVGISFLLAAPVLNPVVIASTYTAFGFGKVLLLRTGLSLAIATLTGLIFSFQRRPERILRLTALMPVSGASGLDTLAPVQKPALGKRIRLTLIIAADEFFEMGRYLILGAVLASLMQTFIPQSTLLAVGTGPVISVFVMVLLAFVLSICSTVDAFVALAFSGTFTTGSILAFLVFGPMVDIKNVFMYLRVFNRRIVIYLVLLPLMMIMLITIYLNLNTNW